MASFSLPYFLHPNMRLRKPFGVCVLPLCLTQMSAGSGRCAGRCPSLSQDLHRQTSVERRSTYMLHLTILKVSKTFPKVLNFLFSTTQQPTDPLCSTSFSAVISNHQHRCLLSHQPQGRCWFAEEEVAGCPGCFICAPGMDVSSPVCDKPGTTVWCPSSPAGAMGPDREGSVFNKMYFGNRQCCSFPGESYQFRVKLQNCTGWELPVKREKISVQPQIHLH